MKNINIITVLVILITIFGSISGYCQSEYYYDYDKYVIVEYSENIIAIEKNESLTDWPNFFDNNDYLERLDNPFPMPNGLYLMKLRPEANISNSLTQLSNSNEVERVERAWISDNADFMFPANKLVVYFKDENAKYIADSIAQANFIPEYKMFLGRENCYLFETQANSYTPALILPIKYMNPGWPCFLRLIL